MNIKLDWNFYIVDSEGESFPKSEPHATIKELWR